MNAFLNLIAEVFLPLGGSLVPHGLSECLAFMAPCSKPEPAFSASLWAISLNHTIS